ncbi:MAG: NAD(P)/FAD-dependent oxidoreductase [Candidatus Methanolliviera hydrocarbonicum]|uniref:Digeranylgeranylglycerophospholipid reductase n=1 Tax=Candidatus Methanolliviera hydrocarbonicum TaxID=2491085 RepID=A0A520KYY0_9EURY|nr:MAG: NAD(P)/FAD-dependent oxidoreductase [Candidatus Methanolliviera hydrocarbonicum]
MSLKNKYDVIVVGAGPGGSMTAKTAAEKGLNVLLIEKRQEIGSPIRCAEGVGKKSFKKFFPVIKDEWISTKMVGVRIYSPDGTLVEISDNRAVGYILERKIFDRDLACMAADAGADVFTKTRATDLIIKDNFVKGVEGIRLGESFKVEADIVVGADGVESKVGRWAGINTTLKPKDIESGAEYLISGIPVEDLCEIYLGNDIAPAGYVWAFPKGENRANVGIGILGSKIGGKIPFDYLNEFVKKKYKNGKIIEVIYGGIPVSRPAKTFGNGIMLVGDAARFTDPITGGGITNAIESGIYAGEVAAECIKEEDTSEEGLKKYEKRWRSTIGEENDRSYLLKEFFINLPDGGLNALAHSINKIKITELSVKGLMRELIDKNPWIPAKLAKLFKKK